MNLVLVFLLSALSIQASANLGEAEQASVTKPCQIIDAGKTEQGWKKLRIAQNDKIISGADSLTEAVNTIETLKSEGECSIQAKNCAFTADGYAQGAWHRSVLLVGDQSVSGANDLGKLVVQFKQLKEKGICE